MKRLLLVLLLCLTLGNAKAQNFDAIFGVRLLQETPEPYIVVRYNYLAKFLSVRDAFYVWVRPEGRFDTRTEESYMGAEALVEFSTFGLAADYKFNGGHSLELELRTSF